MRSSSSLPRIPRFFVSFRYLLLNRAKYLIPNVFVVSFCLMTSTKISKAYQTTISAEAIRRLGLRPGQRVNQIVEDTRLILEPVEDADALAGSLGARKRVPSPSVEELKKSTRRGIARAGMKGMRE